MYFKKLSKRKFKANNPERVNSHHMNVITLINEMSKPSNGPVVGNNI